MCLGPFEEVSVTMRHRRWPGPPERWRIRLDFRPTKTKL